MKKLSFKWLHNLGLKKHILTLFWISLVLCLLSSCTFPSQNVELSVFEKSEKRFDPSYLASAVYVGEFVLERASKNFVKDYGVMVSVSGENNFSDVRLVLTRGIKGTNNFELVFDIFFLSDNLFEIQPVSLYVEKPFVKTLFSKFIDVEIDIEFSFPRAYSPKCLNECSYSFVVEDVYPGHVRYLNEIESNAPYIFGVGGDSLMFVRIIVREKAKIHKLLIFNKQ